MSIAYTVFEYLYRDAGNYKSRGQILLSGTASSESAATLKGCLDSGEFFVAEQVGVPSLHEDLWALSGGKNEDDHAYHEFFELRPATVEEAASMPVWGDVSTLISRFHAAKNRWDCRLSPSCAG